MYIDIYISSQICCIYLSVYLSLALVKDVTLKIVSSVFFSQQNILEHILCQDSEIHIMMQSTEISKCIQCFLGLIYFRGFIFDISCSVIVNFTHKSMCMYLGILTDTLPHFSTHRIDKFVFFRTVTHLSTACVSIHMANLHQYIRKEEPVSQI